MSTATLEHPYAIPLPSLRTLRQRRAVEIMARARRDADAEAGATVRRLRPTTVLPSAQSTRTPIALTATWPPELLGAALLALLLTVGGMLSMGYRYDVASVLPGRGVEAQRDGGAEQVATSASEWRDGVVSP